jgi:drug/metabolite transporter (DMT)-like permease
MIPLIPIIFAVGIAMGSVGGIFMKIGAGQIGRIEINSFGQLVDFLFKLFTNPPSLAGVVLYFGAAVVWSYLLTKLELSLVQPILALTYVLTPILAIFLLQEQVSALRWTGILIIVAGVYVVARSA